VQTILGLVRHGAWANRLVFDLCRGVDPAWLLEPALGTIGTLHQTLEHLVGVEDDCRLTLEGRPPVATVDEIMAHLATYRDRDVAWLAARSEEVAASFERALAGADDAYLDGALRAGMTRRDGLLHVLTHSIHHRAHVLSALGQRGLTVPDVDYGFYLFRPGQTSATD
jgi:uncharacterized damage-inducible protein DinB